MLFAILLVIQILICISMVGVILLQRSEGGALGMGGGPSGFMSARGAGNLLTKTTSVLAALFFLNCLGLAFLGQAASKSQSAIDQVGAANIKLDKDQLKANAASAQAAQAEASSSASSSGLPSLTQLPLPSLAAAPHSDQPQPAQVQKPVMKKNQTGPSAQDTLNTIKIPDVNLTAGNTSASQSATASPPSKR